MNLILLMSGRSPEMALDRAHNVGRSRADAAPPRPLGPLSLREISGAFGDLGTFLPLWLGMVTVCGLKPGMSLLLAGVATMVTGFVFGIPMAVQPMKAIAAVAIAANFSLGAIAAAGLFVGLLVLVLGLTRGLDWLGRWIPRPVVRGVQWAVALQLAIAGAKLVLVAGSGLRPWWGVGGLWWAPVGLAILLLLRNNRLLPAAPTILVLGLAGGWWASSQAAPLSAVPSSGWGLVLPTATDWHHGILLAAIPQLPMTCLNSVIAVCALAATLFPHQRRVATPRKVALSVGLMNVITAPLGGMPVCHGSGGLAAQYGFGARTGTSVVFLGVVKIVVGLFLITPAVVLLTHFPRALLGVWIVAAGMELVRHTAKVPVREAAFAILVPAAVAASVPLVVAAGATWTLYTVLHK